MSSVHYTNSKYVLCGRMYEKEHACNCIELKIEIYKFCFKVLIQNKPTPGLYFLQI